MYMEPIGQIPEEKHNLEASPEEEIDYQEEEVEKKDLTIRITLISIVALTLISAVVFYVGKYTQPEKERVSLFDSIFTQNTQGGTGGTSVSDVLVAQYQEKNATDESLSVSSSTSPTFSSSSTVTLDKDTFAPVTKNKTTPGSTTRNIITEYVIRATSSSAYSTTTRVDTLSATTTSASLGISYKIDPFWVISKKGSTDVPVIVIKKVGPKASDVITVTRFKGSSVSTEDSKYGNVSYYYDVGTSQWMSVYYSNSISANASIEPEPVTQTRFTLYNKPIFEGTSVTKTLIVALNINDFIIVNISGTGYSGILNEFVKNIK